MLFVRATRDSRGVRVPVAWLALLGLTLALTHGWTAHHYRVAPAPLSASSERASGSVNVVPADRCCDDRHQKCSLCWTLYQMAHAAAVAPPQPPPPGGAVPAVERATLPSVRAVGLDPAARGPPSFEG